MMELNKIRGYMIRENSSSSEGKGAMEMKYFVLGTEN